MARNHDPHLLSIEAIIQKSEFGKHDHDFPISYKKTMIDELVSKDL